MTWPAVFDGVGALVVNCSLDPDALVARIPGLTWIAFKVGGDDVAPEAETRHCVMRWNDRGLKVGTWVYCAGPPTVDAATALLEWYLPRFVIYDVEAAYKSDEGGHREWAAQLATAHTATFPADIPSAVTSYGAYKTSIDFAAFAQAGMPIFAQGYDSFTPADAATYLAVYPAAGIHSLTRSLDLEPGEAVYRPESIDG